MVLFARKNPADMDKTEREHACYLHACLRYVQRDSMTNKSIRERFGIDEKTGRRRRVLIGVVVKTGPRGYPPT